MDQFVYKPSKWQATFHSLNTNEALGAGAAGPGKSICLLMDPLPQIMIEHQRCLGEREILPFCKNHPKLLKMALNNPLRWGDSLGRALHLRRQFPMLTDTLNRAQRIFPRIDPKAKWSEKDHTWTFSSGFRYQFGHCADTHSHEIYQSIELTHLAFDEAVQFEEDQYHAVSSRLRSSDPILRMMLKNRSMSNPFFRRGGSKVAITKNPHWLRDRFVEPHRPGKKILVKRIPHPFKDGEFVERTRIYLPATLYDNPDEEFVRQYVQELADKPEHIREALLFGNWFVVPGGYFADAWRRDLHVVRPFRIPTYWKRFRAMDWGYQKPGTIGWWAVDENGELYKEREFNFQRQDVAVVARRVREIEKSMGLWTHGRSGITGPADTQIWENRGDSAKTKADSFAEAGINWLPANKKSRAHNAQRLLTRLWASHPDYLEESTPGICFFENCKKTIQSIPMVQADPMDPEAPCDGGEDHWLDECTYAVAHASRGQALIHSSEETIADDEEEEFDSPSPQSMGTYGYGQW